MGVFGSKDHKDCSSPHHSTDKTPEMLAVAGRDANPSIGEWRSDLTSEYERFLLPSEHVVHGGFLYVKTSWLCGRRERRAFLITSLPRLVYINTKGVQVGDIPIGTDMVLTLKGISHITVRTKSVSLDLEDHDEKVEVWGRVFAAMRDRASMDRK